MVISRDVYFTKERRVEPVSIMYGSAVQIDLHVADAELPDGATTAYSWCAATGECYDNPAVISGNTIQLTPQPGFFLPGRCTLFAVALNGGKQVFPLPIDVKCVPNPALGEIIHPEPVLDLVEQAKQSAIRADAAAAKAQGLVEGLPGDFTDVKNDVKALKDDLTQVSELIDDIKSDNGIKPNMIDGTLSGNSVYTEITDGINQNSAFYVSGNQIKSAGANSNTTRAIIDITNYNDWIEFGFDPNATMYGSIYLIYGEQPVINTAVLGYNNKTEIVGNPHDMFDLSKLAKNRVRLNVGKLKEVYPSCKGLFVQGPNTAWYLAYLKMTRAEKKALDWLIYHGVMPCIVVDANGNGDYTTIQQAVDNAKANDTIFIKDGEYRETVIVNKYVHLAGQSKLGTILYNDIGDYNNCPLLITQGSVSNMTIESRRPADTSGLANYAYALHLDKNFSIANGKCEIFNCNIISEVNDAIGSGTNYSQIFDLHDNFIFVKANPVKSGSCGFKCHLGNAQTGGKVTLKNNTIIAIGSNGTTFYDILFHNGGLTSEATIEVELINNVCKTYRDVNSNFIKNAYCYGNSVASMNTF